MRRGAGRVVAVAGATAPSKEHGNGWQIQVEVWGKLFKVVFVVMMLALLVNTMQPLLALAAPKTAALATTANTTNSAATTGTANVVSTPTNVCTLYPIALHRVYDVRRSLGDARRE